MTVAPPETPVERMAARLLAAVSRPNAAECTKGRFFDRASDKLSQLTRFATNQLVSFDLQAMPPQHLLTKARSGRRSFGDSRTKKECRKYPGTADLLRPRYRVRVVPCMDGARGAREKNLTFRETIRVRRVLRPLQRVPIIVVHTPNV